MQNDLKPDNAPKDLLDWLGLTDTPNWTRGRALGTVVSILLTLLFAMALAAAFTLLGRTLLPSPEPAGGNLGTGALIVALLGAPFLIWNTVIKHRALGFQKEGHLTDRISKAVEQLGAEKTVKVPKADGSGSVETTLPNIEVRIGGILSLERIAQDSTAYDKGRDHVRVMEILCAYIRENAPASGASVSPRTLWQRRQKELDEAGLEYEDIVGVILREEGLEEDDQDTSSIGPWIETLRPPRADIYIALQVIERRDSKQRQIEARWGRAASLSSIWVFDKAPLEPDHAGNALQAQMELYRISLNNWKENIRLYEGYRPDLRGINLQNADLSRFNFSGIRFDKSNLEGVRLSEANFMGASLRYACLSGADLSNTKLQGACLDYATIEAALFSNARCLGTSFFSCAMEGASLWRASLQFADLSLAQLQSVDLGHAQIIGADFWFADLTGARVKFLDLSFASTFLPHINTVFGDATVVLQDGLTPNSVDWPLHWPRYTLIDSDYDIEYEKWRASPSTYTPPPPP